jgi:hypothetical protein
MKQNDRQPNAQKWTTEVVTEHLQEIEKDVSAGNSYFLGRALIKRGLYSQIWKYWKEVFVEFDDITETMLRIETMLEANLLDAALKKELSPYVAMLTLKNNYHWKDRPVNEVAEKAAAAIAEPQVFRPDTNYKAYMAGGETMEVMDLEELQRTLKENDERSKK